MLMVQLALVRPANCLTAAADTAAGWAIAGAAGWASLALVAGASMCLYAGGIALNDVCDAASDARDRPERPIPAGAISRRAALALAVMLFLAGVGLALAAGSARPGVAWAGAVAPGLIAVGLVTAIVLYDAALKRWAAAGSVAMGACRGLNLLLGVSLAQAALGAWWPAAFGHVVFIAGVTAMARHEAGAGDKAARRTGVGLAIAGTVGVTIGWLSAGLAWPEVTLAPTAVGLSAFVVFLAPGLVSAWRAPSPARVRRAVGRGVLGLVLLDAGLAAGFAGWGYGLGIAALAPIAVWLGRRFAVT